MTIKSGQNGTSSSTNKKNPAKLKRSQISSVKPSHGYNSNKGFVQRGYFWVPVYSHLEHLYNFSGNAPVRQKCLVSCITSASTAFFFSTLSQTVRKKSIFRTIVSKFLELFCLLFIYESRIHDAFTWPKNYRHFAEI